MRVCIQLSSLVLTLIFLYTYHPPPFAQADIVTRHMCWCKFQFWEDRSVAYRLYEYYSTNLNATLFVNHQCDVPGGKACKPGHLMFDEGDKRICRSDMPYTKNEFCFEESQSGDNFEFNGQKRFLSDAKTHELAHNCYAICHSHGYLLADGYYAPISTRQAFWFPAEQVLEPEMPDMPSLS